MSQERPAEEKHHRVAGARLGSLSTDTEPSAGRLGHLRMSMPVKKEAEGGGPPGPAAPGAPSGKQSVTHGGAKKKRFAPVNTARRKVKDDPDGTGPFGAGGMAAEAFHDLINQAQTDIAGRSKGIRGRGRGRGRGYGQQRTQVVFGGPAGLPTIAGATASRTSASGGGSGGASGTGGGGGGGGGAKGKGPVKFDADGNIMNPMGDGGGSFLDPDQYYPTLLPLVPAGMEEMDREGEEEMVVPPDLATAIPTGNNAAEEIGLLNSLEDDRLLLFQLPNVFPVSNPNAGKDSTSARHILAPETPPEPACLSLSSLPAGKIGKLLVFESGKVRMQIGEILLDVEPGVPCVFRQDVAAMNADAGHAVFLGDVAQRVVCSPDIEAMLANQEIPQWERRLAGLSLGRTDELKPKKDEEDADADMDVDEKKNILTAGPVDVKDE